jgi:hypothetical protein
MAAPRRARRVRTALAVALFASAACAAAAADVAPNWHPHRIKRRERAAAGIVGGPRVLSPPPPVPPPAASNAAAATPAPVPEAAAPLPAPLPSPPPVAPPTPAAVVAAPVAGGFASTLGCGTLSSDAWERRFCFGPLSVSPGAGAARLPLASLELTVTQRATGGAPDAPFAPACGDTLRVVFTSHRGRFAPDALSESALHCGTHALRVTLPRDARAYGVELSLLHTAPERAEGEGAEAGLAPLSPSAGARLNARVTVPGALTLPPSAVDDPDANGDAFDTRSAMLPVYHEARARWRAAGAVCCVLRARALTHMR